MSQDLVLEIIRNNINMVLPDVGVCDINREHTLKELGANSIDRMEVITSVMEELQVSVPLIEIAPYKAVGELVDFFYQKKKAVN